MSTMDEESTGTRRPEAVGRAPGKVRRVTLHDVAADAGVSVSAVSKVVRGAYGVSPSMRGRVEASISKLSYRPHAGARALRGRSFTIGVVVPELRSPYLVEVAEGVARELEPTPFQEVMIASGVSAAGWRGAIEALFDRQVDGIVLVAPWFDVPRIEELALELPVATVALHGRPKNFDAVTTDEEVGSRMVVDHLISLGHRGIAHIGQPPAELGDDSFELSHTARLRGYLAAMERHGLAPDVIESSYSEEGGYLSAQRLFARASRPTAVFAGADIAAFGVLRAADEIGLRVPEDLSVVGYDNVFASTIPRLALTTVDQAGGQTGATAARLLLERLEGRTGPPSRFVITPRLMERATAAVPRSDGATNG